jgi:hypothetical protein
MGLSKVCTLQNVKQSGFETALLVDPVDDFAVESQRNRYPAEPYLNHRFTRSQLVGRRSTYQSSHRKIVSLNPVTAMKYLVPHGIFLPAGIYHLRAKPQSRPANR